MLGDLVDLLDPSLPKEDFMEDLMLMSPKICCIARRKVSHFSFNSSSDLDCNQFLAVLLSGDVSIISILIFYLCADI